MRNFLSKSFREIESEMGISARKTLLFWQIFAGDYENERELIPARKRKEWQNRKNGVNLPTIYKRKSSSFLKTNRYSLVFGGSKETSRYYN